MLAMFDKPGKIHQHDKIKSDEAGIPLRPMMTERVPGSGVFPASQARTKMEND